MNWGKSWLVSSRIGLCKEELIKERVWVEPLAWAAYLKPKTGGWMERRFSPLLHLTKREAVTKAAAPVSPCTWSAQLFCSVVLSPLVSLVVSCQPAVVACWLSFQNSNAKWKCNWKQETFNYVLFQTQICHVFFCYFSFWKLTLLQVSIFFLMPGKGNLIPTTYSHIIHCLPLPSSCHNPFPPMLSDQTPRWIGYVWDDSPFTPHDTKTKTPPFYFKELFIILY